MGAIENYMTMLYYFIQLLYKIQTSSFLYSLKNIANIYRVGIFLILEIQNQ